MQISLNWINELINIKKISLENLVEKLTLGGFEVEDILEIKINNQKQLTLDISATANRSDSLSIQGFATEISTLLDKPIKNSFYSTINPIWIKNINNKLTIIPNVENYSTFLTISVTNIDNLQSPLWIKNKLKSSGIEPTNNLEDFKNYILLETGYPFEFYDFEKISSELRTSKFDLTIEAGKKGQNFLASNGNTYQLNPNILTVNANNIPISIAGLIESKKFIVSEETNKILIEASIFNGAKIRQQSRNLGLRTERSGRYEKSIKNTYLNEALYRLICLLRISNPNIICKIQTAKQVKETPIISIKLNYNSIHEILGPIINSTNTTLTYLTKKEIENYLTRLNFKFTYNSSKNRWFVYVPHARTEDINREIDIIEEIGRIHGFNNFLTTLPGLKVIGNEDSAYQIRKKLTSCFLNLGLNELVNFSLVNCNTFIPNEINLVNPLLTDCSSLRTSLLPNLISIVKENIKQKNRALEGFEYGHIFSSNSNTKFFEKEFVGGIFGGINTKRSWTDSEDPLTWFEAKGKIEQLLVQLNLETRWTKSTNKKIKPLLHRYRSADIYLSQSQYVGIFGQINPILANQLNISPNTYLFEFNIETIQLNFEKNRLPIYQTYSSYPKIVKDLSFMIKQKIEFNEIKKIIYWNGTELLSKIYLLNEYRGNQIPNDSKSICVQLLFQSETKTLETKKIEKIIKKLELILTERFEAIIRN